MVTFANSLRYGFLNLQFQARSVIADCLLFINTNDFRYNSPILEDAQQMHFIKLHSSNRLQNNAKQVMNIYLTLCNKGMIVKLRTFQNRTERILFFQLNFITSRTSNNVFMFLINMIQLRYIIITLVRSLCFRSKYTYEWIRHYYVSLVRFYNSVVAKPNT